MTPPDHFHPLEIQAVGSSVLERGCATEYVHRVAAVGDVHEPVERHVVDVAVIEELESIRSGHVCSSGLSDLYLRVASRDGAVRCSLSVVEVTPVDFDGSGGCQPHLLRFSELLVVHPE